jgi:hypothetical protein
MFRGAASWRRQLERERIDVGAPRAMAARCRAVGEDALLAGVVARAL